MSRWRPPRPSSTVPARPNEVTAKAADGTDYVNPQDGLFGGWLWLIVKDDQSDDDKQYIKNNYIDEYGKVPETDVHTATVSEWSEGRGTLRHGER